jgi:Xaa-Pro aminopeptidase
MNFQKRIAKISQAVEAAGFDGLLVSRDIHVLYFSGFKGSNGSLLIHKGVAHLFTDSRYITAANIESPHCEIHIERDVINGAIELARKLACGELAVEGDWISATAFQDLLKITDLKISATSDLVEDLRMIKEPSEIAAIETACDITSLSWWQLLEEGVLGKSESDLANRLEHLFRLNGAQDRAFESIVATGPNSAIPHHHPTERLVAKGDLLKIDCGAKYLGYHADMTRTVAIGKAADWQREIYQVVSDSQTYGKSLCKPGAEVFPINNELYSVVREAGYEQNILHASGHGVGLEIHERPFLGRKDGILSIGMPITVEPGIYIEGQGGVRIEDTIEVVIDGYRDLTKANRDFIEW